MQWTCSPETCRCSQALQTIPEEVMCEKGKNSLFTLKVPRLIEQSRPSKLNPDEINLEWSMKVYKMMV